MSKRAALGRDFVVCNGPCGRTLLYNSLNFYPSRFGHKCRQCVHEYTYSHKKARAALVQRSTMFAKCQHCNGTGKIEVR